ncbi:MAG: carboxypeptidase regulatory-like domain-containing protein, partial [Myxococcales bacterium]|nr:carboxypeptidase regulatory-like domain-containing protein [Myxococcales bacterium]
MAALLLVSVPALACDERVSGHVHTLEDEPVAGARVEIDEHVATTADDGRFVMAGVCPGPHEIHVHHVELMPWSGTVVVPTDHLDIELVEDAEVVVVEAPAFSARDPHSRTTVEGVALERQ